MSQATPIDTGVILGHLRALVQADSSDPERCMTPAHPAIVYASGVLERSGFAVRISDHGGGCVNLFAERGQGGTLFNCHLDTVKPNAAWTRDPFAMTLEGDRAYGLGATDIKGGGACLLAVAQHSDAPMSILFSTDEEGGKGVCVESFLRETPGRWARAVVAEPTNAKAVTQHRGFASFEIVFAGTPGHTSGADASASSATHQAIAWGHGALALAEPGGVLDAWRFNIGIVEGGTASNVIAADARVRFGFRPAPCPEASERTGEAIGAIRALLPAGAVWTDRFVAPPLVQDGAMHDTLGAWGIEAAPDVDFWTEAALFARAGVPAIVLGPGDIAQAHAGDEFVDIEQLERCASVYARIVHREAHAMSGGCHAP